MWAAFSDIVVEAKCVFLVETSDVKRGARVCTESEVSFDTCDGALFTMGAFDRASAPILCYSARYWRYAAQHEQFGRRFKERAGL